MTPRLETERLVLRALVPGDADFLVSALNNRAVWEWLSVIPIPYTHADAMRFITEIAPGTDWIIDYDGHPAGVIGLTDELGYWLAQPMWGRGIIREAARAVIAHGFADPARDRILSGHFDANDRSRRVLEALGFRDAGPKTLGCVADGRTQIPSRHMILTRAQWEATQ